MEFKVLRIIALVAIAEIFYMDVVNGATTTLSTPTDDRIVQSQIPIVIKTPERNFDEPNLADFEKCAKDFDRCKQTCESSTDTSADCMEKCPKCPILVIQDSVLQGINDTDLRAMQPKTVNTTNIIRLTNEIHNLIENKLGDITAKNENNINILNAKNSTVGGKYGLGYTEHGPCCIVIRNHEQKQRLCGNRCKARVMHARPVVQCDDENDIATCRQVIEYKPHRPSRHSSGSNYNTCTYQKEWPFISCRNRRHFDYCTPMCLELAYGYILRYGVPLHCVECFKNFDKSDSNTSPIGYLPPSIPMDDNEFRDESEWTLQKSKCRNSDGTITDDCDNIELGSGDDEFIFPENEPMTKHRKLSNSAFDSLQSFDIPRHRRNTFRRSKYSQRYRHMKI